MLKINSIELIYHPYRFYSMKEIMKGRRSMQSKVIFFVLLMLSFTIFHDTFISFIEKKEHTNIAHYINDEAPSPECTELNKIHSMFHFMAIVPAYKGIEIQLVKIESIPHRAILYSSLFDKSTYKPPIV